MIAAWSRLPEMRDHLPPLPASIEDALKEAFRIGYDLGKTDGREEAEDERAIVDSCQIDDGAVVARALSRHRHES